MFQCDLSYVYYKQSFLQGSVFKDTLNEIVF